MLAADLLYFIFIYNERLNEFNFKTPGARGKVIVYTTHFLVVERSYSDNCVEVSFAANLLF